MIEKGYQPKHLVSCFGVYAGGSSHDPGAENADCVESHQECFQEALARGLLFFR